jgi:hypothetical protein
VKRLAVVIELWDGPVVEPVSVPPSQADLDALAVEWTAPNCGVRPVVRTICNLALPGYSNPREAWCEDTLGSGALDHGHRRGMEVRRQ